MACGQIRSVYLLAALVVVATAQLEDDTRSSMMRRHKSNSQVHLGAKGEMQLHEDPHREVDTNSPQKPSGESQAYLKENQDGKVKQPGETSYCDTNFVLAADNTNVCKAGTTPIEREEDCRKAAKRLKLGQDAGEAFVIKDDWVNPDIFPKNCFKHKGKAYFNPTASVGKSFKGTPICEHPIYTKAKTSGLDSKDACAKTGVKDGPVYEEITDYKECEWAHDCEWGAMECQVATFGDDHHSTEEAPRGCYRNGIGCYGWNNNKKAPKGISKETTAICRLKGHVFQGLPANTPEAAAKAADGGNETAAA